MDEISEKILNEAADEEGGSTVKKKIAPFDPFCWPTRIHVLERCRAHQEFDHEWHVMQLTPRRQVAWFEASCRMFILIDASQKMFVCQAGCLATCEMSLTESTLPPTLEEFRGEGVRQVCSTPQF